MRNRFFYLLSTPAASLLRIRFAILPGRGAKVPVRYHATTEAGPNGIRGRYGAKTEKSPFTPDRKRHLPPKGAIPHTPVRGTERGV